VKVLPVGGNCYCISCRACD